ncbi:hypothetical protein DAPPUDRAFT_234011 [Daphnia pulex]|uniref:Uncharacterized protein n=1 Tax=Daphnia pulex TaxID=6669 RepID=E9FUC5_DAPPU|nr:hypothetical protein DAPPUDRAFT_234011 [Daphnia pulex]|eukprot:EFX88701.1 hypothetical protein DAPPUDRAFT_234011 [Daphnia pulex]
MRYDREANFIKRISRSGCPERGDQSLSDGRRMEIEIDSVVMSANRVRSGQKWWL